MASKENCVRVTRLAKRRAAAAALGLDEQARPTKRVALSELSVNYSANHELTTTKPRGKPKKTTTFVSSEVVFDDAKTDDPQMCGDYVVDIVQYLRKLEMEPRRRPLPNYLQKVQVDVTANMRGILVDWLVDVAEEYNLLSDTLYLAISYVDRYLSLDILHRKKLQLLGVSSMLIASKYEEIKPPNIEDFSYITDNAYSKEEIVQMEADILKALSFELGGPTLLTFLRRFTCVAQESYKNQNLLLEFLGCYLAELSLLDYQCVKFLPSLVAASVVFLAKFIIRPKLSPWNATLRKYSGYNPSDLKNCVLAIHDLYLSRRGAALQAVREKYKQHKFKLVAAMASPPEVPAKYLEDIE